MTDAELIYDACLRAERRLADECAALKGKHPAEWVLVGASLLTIKTLREEVGNGLARGSHAIHQRLGDAGESKGR